MKSVLGLCSAIFPICLVFCGLFFELPACATTADPWRSALLGGLPPGAREAGKAEEGVSIVELSEDVPEQIKPGDPFSAWLVWPVQDWNWANSFIKRAHPFSMDAQTPIGTFRLGVRPLSKAVRKKGNEEGLLTVLCFDPAKKGPLLYPWPEVFKAARERRMLTQKQEDSMSTVEKFVSQQYSQLPREWSDFAQSTYVMYTRRQLFRTLADLYALPPGYPPAALDPRNFFNRDQRIQLRTQGHTIVGSCFIRCEDDRFAVELKNCPISQLVAQWNRIAKEKLVQPGGNELLLAVADDRRHAELDIALDIKGTPMKEAAKIAFGALLNIPGVQMRN
jgi:hypothetical protein